jgi:hypothetical protein
MLVHAHRTLVLAAPAEQVADAKCSSDVSGSRRTASMKASIALSCCSLRAGSGPCSRPWEFYVAPELARAVRDASQPSANRLERDREPSSHCGSSPSRGGWGGAASLGGGTVAPVRWRSSARRVRSRAIRR